MEIHNICISREGVGSEKYKAAVEYGKACVVPAWVVESARKGVCEPLAKYRVAGASTSSPLAEHRLPDMSKYSKDSALMHYHQLHSMPASVFTLIFIF